MIIDIDKNSGYCFGVTNAVKTAEQYLSQYGSLYCLGDIVHNDAELKRLSKLGLTEITYNEFKNLSNCTVLIRAHGEPPETYQIADQNNIKLIDATCPVVLNLQRKIKNNYLDHPDLQVVIAGKHGHAEVVGLLGQIQNNGIVISKMEDLDKIDYHKPSCLYAQTTFNIDTFKLFISEIQQRYNNLGNDHLFTFQDSICKQVSHRKKAITKFVEHYDLVLFVSGEKSSNGQQLFQECKSYNPNTVFVSSYEIFDQISLEGINSIGICGATSTPMWLMEETKMALFKKLEKDHQHNDSMQ
jgi:4-hydroxy-3-methylbut-2-en-1-yl diphosphate reductase